MLCKTFVMVWPLLSCTDDGERFGESPPVLSFVVVFLNGD